MLAAAAAGGELPDERGLASALTARYSDDEEAVRPASPAKAQEAAPTRVLRSGFDDEDDNSDSDWEVDDDGFRYEPGGARNDVTANSAMQPKSKRLQRLETRVNTAMTGHKLDVSQTAGLPATVATSVRENMRRGEAVTVRTSEKQDRATVEQALDPKTRLILLKMLNQGVFKEINGCISTGKEANVYHAVTESGTDLAVKVYKTSILVFKDRDRYVAGDWRFRNGYCRSNPRKMVRTWAEKEMRNLTRLVDAGLFSPQPRMLRNHVLVMDFIGSDGVAAPRLKDAIISTSKLGDLYAQLLVDVRTLFQVCRLAHGDLSEYNILYHEGRLAIIDVSQSVDLDHPRCFEFLKEDLTHINAFFSRKGVPTATVQQLFEFVTDPAINEGNIDACVARLRELAELRDARDEDSAAAAEEQIAQHVFRNAYIPRRLEEVTHFERDAARLASGVPVEGVYYQTVTGLQQDLSVRQEPTLLVAGGAADAAAADSGDASPGSSGDDSEEEGDDSEEGSSGSEEEGGEFEERKKVSKEEVRAARKANKSAVKEQAREKRKEKMPKHIKKQKTRPKHK